MPIRLPRRFAIVLFALCGCAPLAAQPATARPELELLRNYLAQQVLQRGLQGQVDIQLDASKLAPHPVCSNPEAFLAGQGQLRSRISVGLRCLAPDHWLAYIPAQLRVMGQYPVAAHPIAPNTVLGANDITLLTGDLMRLPSGAAVTVEGVLGYTAVQRIGTNQVLKHNTLQAPHSVSRGQPVTLQVRGPGFTVTGEGIAIQAGPPGAVIQVRTQSGEIVQGRVLNAQTVVVAM